MQVDGRGQGYMYEEIIMHRDVEGCAVRTSLPLIRE